MELAGTILIIAEQDKICSEFIMQYFNLLSVNVTIESFDKPDMLANYLKANKNLSPCQLYIIDNDSQEFATTVVKHLAADNLSTQCNITVIAKKHEILDELALIDAGVDELYLENELGPEIIERQLYFSFARSLKNKKSFDSLSIYKSLINKQSDCIIFIDRRGRIKLLNDAGRALLGIETIGKNEIYLYHHLIVEKSDNILDSVRERVINSTLGVATVKKHSSAKLTTLKGRVIPVNFTSKLLFDETGYCTGCFVLITDISAQIQTESKITKQAYYDVLTSLPNQYLFEEVLAYQIQVAKRNKESLNILQLDLDDFKQINLSYGHLYGDMLIQEIANRLEESVRSADFLARVQSDEFAIVLEGVHDKEDGNIAAQRILEIFTVPFKIGNTEVIIHPSIGMATFPKHGETPGDLINASSIALYKAKKSGKNQYAFYKSTDSEDEINDGLQEADFVRAINKNEFFLVYQPQFSIKTLELLGFEVLLRWQHPTRGLLAPDSFIAIAEKNNQIISVGKWVLETACAQYKFWQAKNIITSPLTMAINLSCKQFMDAGLLDDIKNTLSSVSLPPNCLEIEVTETAIMENINHTVELLQALKAMGINSSIDDFGTSYSSLQYLKSLPVSSLKIDKSFVQQIHTDLSSLAIVKAIIELSHILNMDVTAEGVETRGQLEFLQKNNCDYGQGYYYSKPLSIEDMESFIKKFNEIKVKAIKG